MSSGARLIDRLLAWVGLDFDFAIDLHSEPISELDDVLCLGARPTPADVPALQRLGITHVVSCLPASEREAMAFLQRDFTARFVALHDGIHEDISVCFADYFATMEQVAEQRDGRLLVHCQVGVSRSATLATAWWMRSRRLPFYEAICQLRSRRPGVLPNIGFASQLQALERSLSPAGQGPTSLARYLREFCCVPEELAVIDEMLAQHDEDAVAAVSALFDGEIPRVVQGVRV